MTRPWPATCATCGKPVRKAESHSGAPGSGVAVRHLDCATPAPCTECGAPRGWYGPCPQCGSDPAYKNDLEMEFADPPDEDGATR